MTRLAAILLVVSALFPGALRAHDDPPRAPVTILVSIDGFRADYLERGITPTLSRLAREGAHGKLRPSFPTKTFPNHYAMVTGLRPDRNGITGNRMIDPRRPGARFSLGDPVQSLDPFWWNEAEPVWVSATRAGVRSATMFWPGSEVEIGKVRPADWLRFDKHISGEQRVTMVLDWMRRPAAIRPDFVTLYFDTVDTAGHLHGPGAPETDQAIADVDALLGTLVDGLAAMGQPAKLVIVSDHGMRATSSERIVQLGDLIEISSLNMVETGPYAAIEAVPGHEARVASALLRRHEHMQCHRREALPARLHYGRHRRVASIICIAEPGWSIMAGKTFYSPGRGDHGYDNADPQMLALFVAHGTHLSGDVGIHDNIEIYPLVMQQIGVVPRPSDALGTLLGPRGE